MHPFRILLFASVGAASTFCLGLLIVSAPADFSPKASALDSQAPMASALARSGSRPATPSVAADPRRGLPAEAGERQASPLREFRQWTTAFARARPDELPALIAEGERLASERQRVMAALIEEDPEEALRQAVSPHLHRELPMEIRRHLETPIGSRGDLFTQFICSFDAETDEPEAGVQNFARIGDRVYLAHLNGEPEEMAGARDLPLRGIALGNSAAIAERSPLRYWSAEGDQVEEESVVQSARENGAEWDAPASTGARSLLYVRVDFPDQEGSGVTQEEAERHMAELADHIARMSDGKFLLARIEIVPEIIRLPHEASYYREAEDRFFRVREDTIAALRAHSPSYDMAEFDLDVILLPPNHLSATGAAFVESRGIFIDSGRDPDALAPAILHEIGHNLGLEHARGARSYRDDPFERARTFEHGDPADAMGVPKRLMPFNIYFKHRLGWLEEDQWIDVTRSGTYRLFRHDLSEPAGLRGIRIDRLGHYSGWIDMQEDSRGKGGVAVRRPMWRASDLLDMTPATATFKDYPLLGYSSAEDTYTGTTIEVSDWGFEEGHGYADITITFSGPPKILEGPESATLTEGDAHVLRVEAGGSPPFSYTWYKDDEPIPGATQPELFLSSVTPEDTGLYRVEVENGDGISGRQARLLVYAAHPKGGRVDTAFSGAADGWIYQMAEDQEGRIYLGGSFEGFDGIPRPNLLRLLPDGRMDEEFDPGDAVPGPVAAVAVQPDGRVLAGGDGWIVRLTAEGAADASFAPAQPERADGTIASIVIQPDGAILAGGGFERFDGQYTGPLVRLHPGGKLAGAIGAYTERPSYFDKYGSMSARLEPEPGGKVLAVTTLRTGWTGPTYALHRLEPDGTVDPSFQAPGYTKFGPAAVLPELDAGKVTGYWVVYAHQVFLQRLHADGTPDPDFRTFEIGKPVRGAGQDREGRIYLFVRRGSSYSDPAALYRLTADGQFDPTFRCEVELGRNAIPLALASGDLLIGNPGGGGANPLKIFARNPPATAFTAWAERHGHADPEEDADGRGIPNLLRYAFGMTPSDPEPGYLPRPTVVTGGEEEAASYLALTFRRRDQAEDLRYAVEASADLMTWEELKGEPEAVAATATESGISLVTVRDRIPLEDQEKRFLRLNVILNPDTAH